MPPYLLALVIFLTYITTLSIYRLTLHPLAKYPGPFLAKITSFYPLYHSWKGDRHLTFWRCHEKYGDFVRYGPNQLSINTGSALKTIYGFKANVKKSSWYRVFLPAPGAWSVWTCVDKALHGRKRHALAHAFSDTALRDIEHYVLSNVQTFCEQLVSPDIKDGEWSSAHNMSDLSNYLTFDILGELAFGKGSFSMLTEPDNRFIVDLIANNAYRCMMCGTMPIIHDLGIDKLFFPNLVRDRQTYMAFSKSQALERSRHGLSDGDRKDFFHYLLNAKDPITGTSFSLPELWAESNLLIIAGSDTPATAIAACFYYLVRNERVLRKLEDEILATFENGDEVTNSNPKLPNCTYLRACIDEAMRMSPSVTGTVPREVLPGGIDIDGQHIPSGTVVGTGFYSLHHNPTYFSQPFTYTPERWIAGSMPSITVESVERAKEGFFPFSYGPRGCLGKNLAYMELRTVVARTVWEFEMRGREGCNVGDVERGSEECRTGEFGLQDRWQAVKNGPMVEFRKRAR